MLHSPELRKLAAVAVLFAVQATHAFAIEQKTFDAAAFKATQDGGKPAIIHVHADWCPTCKSQRNVINDLSGNDAFNDVIVFTIDFDAQPADWKRFKATSQSTLIAFSGTKETGRLVGETGAMPIEALVHSAIAK